MREVRRARATQTDKGPEEPINSRRRGGTFKRGRMKPHFRARGPEERQVVNQSRAREKYFFLSLYHNVEVLLKLNYPYKKSVCLSLFFQR